MERGRILILGGSKETTYEIRNLLDNHRFELEIALSKEVGEQVLTIRKMNLIMIHTELLKDDEQAFFSFLRERSIDVPVFVLGDEAERFRSANAASTNDVHYFGKPYVTSDVMSRIDAL